MQKNYKKRENKKKQSTKQTMIGITVIALFLMGFAIVYGISCSNGDTSGNSEKTEIEQDAVEDDKKDPETSDENGQKDYEDVLEEYYETKESQQAHEAELESNIGVSLDKDENNQIIESYEWSQDTNFNKKENELPYQLYEIPFARSDYYIPNKMLTKYVEDKDIAIYESVAEKLVKALYGKDYEDILADQDAYIEDVEDLLPDAGNEVTKNGEVMNNVERSAIADQMMQWYVDNRAVLDAELHTDHNMFYEDNHVYYLRGEMVITAAASKEALQELTDICGLELENGKPVSYMVEFQFIPGYMETVNMFEIKTKI